MLTLSEGTGTDGEAGRGHPLYLRQNHYTVGVIELVYNKGTRTLFQRHKYPFSDY